MDLDWIRMNSDLDSTFYHILIRIQIQILSDTYAKHIIRFRLGYFLDLVSSQVSICFINNLIIDQNYYTYPDSWARISI
jgi:hypothetical protein